MPVDVVDALEVVDIEQNQSDIRTLARRTGKFGSEALLEVAAVEEAGQLVGPGLLREQLAAAGVVVGQGGEGGEALDQLSLLRREGRHLALHAGGAVLAPDVQGADDAVGDDQRAE